MRSPRKNLGKCGIAGLVCLSVVVAAVLGHASPARSEPRLEAGREHSGSRPLVSLESRVAFGFFGFRDSFHVESVPIRDPDSGEWTETPGAAAPDPGGTVVFIAVAGLALLAYLSFASWSAPRAPDATSHAADDSQTATRRIAVDPARVLALDGR